MKKYLAIFVFVRFFSPNSTQANSFAQIAPFDDADFFIQAGYYFNTPVAVVNIQPFSV